MTPPPSPELGRSSWIAVSIILVTVFAALLTLYWSEAFEAQPPPEDQPLRPLEPSDPSPPPTEDPLPIVPETEPVMVEEPEPITEIRIVGEVTDPEGAPLEGAQVIVSETGDPPHFEEAGRRPTTAQTDRRGRFERTVPFEGSAVGLLVWHAAWAAARIPDLRPDENGALRVSVVLEPGGSIEGHVYGPEDQLLPGAQVRAAASMATTDQQGHYRLEGVPSGTWRVVAAARGYQPSENPAVTIHETAVVRGIDLELKELVSITGRVRTSSGEPVAGARVSAKGPHPPWTSRPGIASTRSDGAFELGGLLSAVYELNVSAGGYLLERSVSVSAPNQDVVLEVTPGFELELELIGPQGQPYRGAFDLMLESAEDGEVLRRSFASTRPDQPGRASVGTVLPGAYVARVLARGWYGREAFQLQIGDEAEPVRVYLDEHPPTTLEGRVVRSDGAPVVGASVWIGGGAAARIGRESLQAAKVQEVPIAKTDDEGRFRLENIASGEVAVFLAGPEVGLDRDIAQVDLGAIRSIEITVEKRASASGRIAYRNQDGSITRSGRVRFQSDELLLDIPTDSGGRFVTGWIPPGRYDFEVRDHGGGVRERRTIHLAPGASERLEYEE